MRVKGQTGPRLRRRHRQFSFNDYTWLLIVLTVGILLLLPAFWQAVHAILGAGLP